MSRTKLFVGNLNRDAREEEMREFFGRLGEVRSVQVRNGYGFVVRLIDYLTLCHYGE